MKTIKTITEKDLEWLGTGTAILGSGGGGQPRIGRLRLRSLLQDESYPDAIEIIDPDHIDPAATVTSVGHIGAPTIGSEKLPKGDEELRALRKLEQSSGRKVDFLIPGEIGGANSFAPLITALQVDLPVVDADAMGRALPELQMDTFFINGKSVDHAVVTDEKSNTLVFEDIDTPNRFEQLTRQITVELGGTIAYAYPVLDGEFVSEYSVPRTLSLSHNIGKAVHEARAKNEDPVQCVCQVTNGEAVFSGRVSAVERRHDNGFTTGVVEIEAQSDERTCTIIFQNEYLHLSIEEQTVATVPDLISLLDTETAEPLLSDDVEFGQRVEVVCIPAPDLLTTSSALEVVGPEAFNYNEEYSPFTERI